MMGIKKRSHACVIEKKEGRFEAKAKCARRVGTHMRKGTSAKL